MSASSSRLVEWFCTVGLPESPSLLSRGSVDTPIFGLCLVCGKDDPPNGYDRLGRTWRGQDASLTKGSAISLMNQPVYLCSSRVAGERRGVVNDKELQTRTSPEAPIVDVIVLHLDKGDKCPPHYSLVQPYGPTSRSISLIKHVSIAYARAVGSVAVVDIALCRANNRNTLSSLQHSLSTSTLSGQRSKEGSFTIGTSSVYSKGENIDAPRLYKPVRKMLNPQAMNAYSLYICVRHAPNSLATLPLSPVLIDRIPRTDMKGHAFPDVVPMMIFPEGIFVQSGISPPASSVLSLVVTLTDGRHINGIAYCHWESCSLQLQPLEPTATQRPLPYSRRGSLATGHLIAPQKMSILSAGASVRAPHHHNVRVPFACFPGQTPPLPPNHSYWAPRALVILSFHPFYNAFTRILHSLHTLVHSHDERNIPVERVLMNIWEAPVPRFNHPPVQLNVLSEKILLSSPSQLQFPVADFTFIPLFECLPVDCIIDVIEAMLNEQRIILRSNDPTVLTPVAEALSSLFLPFQWVSPYTPIIPSTNVHIITQGSEMPMLGGALFSYMPFPELTNSMLFVDLDENRISLDTDMSRYAKIPDDLRSRLKKELIEHAYVDSVKKRSPMVLALLNSTEPAPFGSGKNDDAEIMRSTSPAFNTVACRACFLHLFVSLLQGLDEYLLYPTIADNSGELDTSALFDLNAWLAMPVHKTHKSLLAAIGRTQFFAQYVHDKTYLSSEDVRRLELDFFKRCCDYEEILMHNPSKNLVMFLSQLKFTSVPFVVPGPDTTGLIADQTFMYNGMWPLFDVTLFRNPRPVGQSYLRQHSTDAPATTTNEALIHKRGISPATAFMQTNIERNHSKLDRVKPELITGDRQRVQTKSANTKVSLAQTSRTRALSQARHVYATWFELMAICLPLNPEDEKCVFLFETLVQMTSDVVVPDEGIFRCALIVCGRLGRRDFAHSVFNTMTQRGFKPTPAIYAAYHFASLQRGTESTEDNLAVQLEDSLHNLYMTSTQPIFTPIVPEELPSSKSSSISFDPYRLQAERHVRLILKAQRQQVQWHTICCAAFCTCEACYYEMSAAEVLAALQQSEHRPCCTDCGAPFYATLRVAVTIITRPARLKAIVSLWRLKKPLAARQRRYHITLPLLTPAKMRYEFTHAIEVAKSDFLDLARFRVMQEVLYWNMVYHLSHPDLRLRLTFIANLSQYELMHLKIKRLQRAFREADDDPMLSNPAHNIQPKVVKTRTIETTQGLRERDLQQLATLSRPSRKNYLKARYGLDDEDNDDGDQLVSDSRLESTSSDVDNSMFLPLSVLMQPELKSSPAALSSSGMARTVSSPDPSLPTRMERSIFLHGQDWAKEKEIVNLLQRREMLQAMEFFLMNRVDGLKEAGIFVAAFEHQSSLDPLSKLIKSASGWNISKLLNSSISNITRSPQSAQAPLFNNTDRLQLSECEALPNPPAKLRKRSASCSKSSDSSMNGFGTQPLATVIGSVVKGFTSTLDDPNSPQKKTLKNTGIAPMQTSSSHSTAISRGKIWFPMRDASPLARLHDRCMFECIYACGIKYYESYNALADAFNVAIKQLSERQLSVMTSMDLAPNADAMALEIHLGMHKRKRKKLVNDAPHSANRKKSGTVASTACLEPPETFFGTIKEFALIDGEQERDSDHVPSASTHFSVEAAGFHTKYPGSPSKKRSSLFDASDHDTSTSLSSRSDPSSIQNSLTESEALKLSQSFDKFVDKLQCSPPSPFTSSVDDISGVQASANKQVLEADRSNS